ncbi:MAG: hypothetical protein EOQ42_05040 [Mesorhizobium sp.]|nr:MAG: hypothetical protein EOQ42_05040 [Mesorhizobium sp.]
MSLLSRAILGVLAVACAFSLAFWMGRNSSAIVRTTEVSGTVISVVSGEGGARYFVQLNGSRTILIPGPTLPLYPVGATVTLLQDIHENGSDKYHFPP